MPKPKKPAPRARKAAAPPPPPPPPPAPPKRGRGKPPYEPTGEHTALARNLIAGSVTQERIAAALGISVPTLRKHYKDAIRIGQSGIDALSVSTLVRAMQEGGRAAVVAAVWWQRSKMGWSEHVPGDDKRAADETMRVIIEFVGDAPKTIEHEQARQRPGFDVGKHVELVG